jgi:hypothetical protein
MNNDRAIQTKLDSLKESFVNILVGYSVSVVSQLLIFPMFGIDVPLSSNIKIGLWFTAVSLVRSYVIRRWFNKK